MRTRLFMVMVMLVAAGIAAAALVAWAQQAATWSVAVGGETPDHGVQANIFAPGTITVHAGDTVTWTMAALYVHTVTFLSGSPEPSIAIPQKNGKLLVNPKIALPQGGATHNGRGVASSGFLEGRGKRYSLTFTTPGRYAYVCLIHPGQRGMVVVVPPGRPLPFTQAQYDARGAAEIGRALERGTSAMRSIKTSVTRRRGAATYTVPLVGAAGPASVDRFVPETLNLKAGDRVRWVMQDPAELHTVTLTGPGGPPEFIVAVPRSQGPPTLYFNSKGAAPAGGPVHTGPGFYNSGFMTAGNIPGTVRTYTLTFRKPGAYTYWCLVHVAQGMKGTIVVQ